MQSKKGTQRNCENSGRVKSKADALIRQTWREKKSAGSRDIGMGNTEGKVPDVNGRCKNSCGVTIREGGGTLPKTGVNTFRLKEMNAGDGTQIMQREKGDS